MKCRFYQLSYNFCIKTEERIHFGSLRPVSDKYQITFPSPLCERKIEGEFRRALCVPVREKTETYAITFTPPYVLNVKYVYAKCLSLSMGE